MLPFRWTLTTAVASIFLSVAFGKAGGQTAKDQPTLTTAELARAIARTIDAHTLRSPPGSPLEFKSATSVGNVVEMKYLVNDLASFDRLKSKSESVRTALAGYWCNDQSRAASLQQGVSDPTRKIGSSSRSISQAATGRRTLSDGTRSGGS
jgi:hypothetical protein